MRYSIFKVYQQVDYVETVIARNDAHFVDRLTVETMEMLIADYGFQSDITLNTGLSFDLDVLPFQGAEAIVKKQLEDEEIRT